MCTNISVYQYLHCCACTSRLLSEGRYLSRGARKYSASVLSSGQLAPRIGKKPKTVKQKTPQTLLQLASSKEDSGNFLETNNENELIDMMD